MTSKITGSILGLALAVLTSSVAGAATIAGPALTNNDSTYSVTGLEFHALGNATLTGFTFQNQGLADMVDLVSTTGTILHSVSIPAGTAPDVVSGLTWSLTSGTSYWLLQTTLNNGKFFFLDGGALPSDADIAIVFGGTFSSSISTAIAPSLFTSNEDYADFNNITTSGPVSATPLPAALPLFATGLGALGLLGWRRKRKTSAIAA
jgi:hypothetical protein